MAKRRSGQGSVLSRQKPKRKRGKGNARLFLAAAAVFLLIAAGVIIKRQVTRLAATNDPRIDWKVQLKLASDQPLDDKLAEAITQTAQNQLGLGQKKDLTKVAATIQKQGAFANVQILKLSNDEVQIHLKPRVPVLCAEADRLRFIADDGDVYGEPDSAAACPGPTLVGLTEANAGKLTLKSDASLALDANTQILVKEALELVKEGKQRGFSFATLSHRKYRGFAVTLPGDGPEIALGRAPFASKLERLRGLLQKLEAKGEQAARIELDYQGKAFIKHKKM